MDAHDLTLTHTETEGTLLHGTSRGDGVGPVITPLGWRWSRTLGLWYVPASRGREPGWVLISSTIAQLRSAGFLLCEEIDASLADRQELEEQRAARAQQRADRLNARADREEARARAAEEARAELSEWIPFGQPVLLGHHSQRRAERDGQRLRDLHEAAVTHRRRAQAARQAAAAASASVGARHSPSTVSERIHRLEAEIRRLQRAADDPAADEAFRERIEDWLARDRADLEYWSGVRRQLVDDGVATDYGPEVVRVGDSVRVGSRWYTVLRVNAKTVAVDVDGHTGKVLWHKVLGHLRAEDPGVSSAAGRAREGSADHLP